MSNFTERCYNLYKEPDLYFDFLTLPHKAVNGFIWTKIEDSKGSVIEKAWHVARWASNALFLILNAPAVLIKRGHLSINNYLKKQEAMGYIYNQSSAGPSTFINFSRSLQDDLKGNSNMSQKTPTRLILPLARINDIAKNLEAIFDLHNQRCEMVTRVDGIKIILLAGMDITDEACQKLVIKEDIFPTVCQVQIYLRDSTNQILDDRSQICRELYHQELNKID